MERLARGAGESRIRLFVRLPDCPAETDLAVVDAEVEATFGVRTNPRLVGNGSAVAAIVAQWYQCSAVTLAAFREFVPFRHSPLRANSCFPMLAQLPNAEGQATLSQFQG
jgi:hypothetical protein